MRNCTILTRIPNSGVRCKNDSIGLAESDKKSDCDSTQKPLTPGDFETDSTTTTLLKTVRSYFFRTFVTHEGQFVRRNIALGLGNTSFLTSHQCSLSYRQSNGADCNNRSKIPTYNRLKLFNSFQKYRI